MEVSEMMLLALLLAFHTGAPAPCTGSQLWGAFGLVPGSAGAGNVVYRLRVYNGSKRTCYVSGQPVVRLLGRNGKPLPTKETPAHPGMGSAAMIVLTPGKRAHADFRFSPDVPGPGEGGRRQCEPKAYSLRVTAPGGGTFRAKVLPPTAVCSHGALQVNLYTKG
jgi:hypothetical protein